MKKILNRPEDYVDEMLVYRLRASPILSASRRQRGGRAPNQAGKVAQPAARPPANLPAMWARGCWMPARLAMSLPRPLPSRWPTPSAPPIAGQGCCALRQLWGDEELDMAGELVELQDITRSTVLLADDVASAPASGKAGGSGNGLCL